MRPIPIILSLALLAGCDDGTITVGEGELPGDDDPSLSAGTAPAASYGLTPAAGQVVTGLLAPRLSLTSAIASVDFTLRSGSGSVVRSSREKLSPFCLMGDSGTGGCNALDTTTLADGRYRLEAAVSFADGSSNAYYSTFFVENRPAPSSTGLGRTFYVSATSGDDSRSLTQAQSPSTPWKSLAKVNASWGSFAAGDSILLQRGTSYTGSLVFKKGGATGKPLTVGAYGQGPRPIISGFTTVSGWTSVGGGVWQAPCNCGSTLRVVAMDGAPQRLGRWPNADAANAGYRKVESHSGQSSLTDSTLPSSPSWVGGEVVARTARWSLDRYKITGHSASGTLSLGAQVTSYGVTSGYEPNDGRGYFIQNHPRTLDQPGEWFYDPASKKLSMVFDSAGPAGHLVQASTIDVLVDDHTYDFIRLDSLSLRGANLTAIYLYGASDSVISNSDVRLVGGTGINLGNSPRTLVTGSTIAFANDWGVFVPGGSNASILRGNVITDTGTMAGMADTGGHSMSGLRVNGDDNQIVDNEIIRSGYNGIRFTGDRVLVQNNLIRWFTMAKDDGGGIYTGNTGSNIPVGRKVYGNTVLDGVGAEAGSGATSSATSGIYTDDGSAGIDIRGNTVARVGLNGLFVHNGHQLTIADNTFYDCGNAVMFLHDTTRWPAITEDDLLGNLLFAKTVSQGVLVMQSIDGPDGLANLGIFDDNIYARPLEDEVKIAANYKNASGTLIYGHWDLPGWRLQYGQDGGSTGSAVKVPVAGNSTPVGTNRVANGGLATASTSGFSCSSCSAAIKSAGRLDGNYLEITPSGSLTSSLSVSIGAVTAGKRYRLRFSLRGASDQHISLGTYLRTPGSPYAKLTPVVRRTMGTGRRDLEVIFVASQSESNARLFFELTNSASAVYDLDNLELVEVADPATNPDAVFHLEANPSPAPRTVPLTGTWFDVKGGQHTGQVTIPAWGSLLLIQPAATAATGA